MHVRCSYCSHSFNLGRDFLAAAVAEATTQKHKTHAVECPNCRKHIKIPLAQIKRFAPANAPTPPETPTE
jgi:hypothetical protein